MQYNTKKDKIVMPEYGRGVQQMVEIAKTLPRREDRQQCARSIVCVMRRLVPPETTNQAEYEQTLWNHLARIARYELDIDYPVEIVPEQETINPAPLCYPMKSIRRRHYGYLIETYLKYLNDMPDSARKEKMLGQLANQMKQDLYVWNRDSMSEQLVAKDIERYSDGMLHLSPGHKFAPVGEPSAAGMQKPTGKRRRRR